MNSTQDNWRVSKIHYTEDLNENLQCQTNLMLLAAVAHHESIINIISGWDFLLRNTLIQSLMLYN